MAFRENSARKSFKELKALGAEAMGHGRGVPEKEFAAAMQTLRRMSTEQLTAMQTLRRMSPEQLTRAQQAIDHEVQSRSSKAGVEGSPDETVGAAPFGKSKEGPPKAAWLHYDDYYYSIEGGRSHKAVYEKYLEDIVGSRKRPTKEILNCTQGTPNPDRPGQETAERQQTYKTNAIKDERAQQRPGTYADVAMLMAIRDACSFLRDKSSWEDLMPWTEGDQLHLLEGVEVEKVVGATGSTQTRVKTITVNDFPLPAQDIMTEAELDLSGKGLGAEGATIVAALIPLNVSVLSNTH